MALYSSMIWSYSAWVREVKTIEKWFPPSSEKPRPNRISSAIESWASASKSRRLMGNADTWLSWSVVLASPSWGSRSSRRKDQAPSLSLQEVVTAMGTLSELI